MNKELKNLIIVSLLTAALTSVGFFVTQEWNERNRKKQSIEAIHKDLYDKGASALSELEKEYGMIYGLMSNKYAISTFEWSERYENFYDALVHYQDYVSELRRYGTSSQVETAGELFDSYRLLYADFNALFSTSELIESQMKNHLTRFAPFRSEEEINGFNNRFVEDLDRLMQYENSVYYEVAKYKMPLIRAQKQLLFFHFRQSLGLEATVEMAELINRIPEISKRNPENVYKESPLPFMFAEQRAMQAPTLEFSKDDDFLVKKNITLRDRVLVKFGSLVIENNEPLKKMIEDKKAANNKF